MMARAELLARLNPKTVRFDVGFGGIPELTPEIIAGACAYANLGKGAYYLGLAKYMGDSAALIDLEYYAWMAAADIAAKRKWKIEPGKPYLRGIARLACCVAIDPGRCRFCGGTGFNKHHKACRVCGGSGMRRAMSLRKQAAVAQIPMSSYQATWLSRAVDVLEILNDWDDRLGRHLSRQLSGE